jgi:hypothetical protein
MRRIVPLSLLTWHFVCAAPGEWGVVFHNIDEAAPSAEFRFTLLVGDAYARAWRYYASASALALLF